MTEEEFWARVATLEGRVEEARFDQLTAALAPEVDAALGKSS